MRKKGIKLFKKLNILTRKFGKIKEKTGCGLVGSGLYFKSSGTLKTHIKYALVAVDFG